MGVGIATGDSDTFVETLLHLTTRCLAEFFCKFKLKERGAVKYYCCESYMFFKASQKGVLNGYKHNKANATAKGLSSSIKVMKRIGYSYKRFSRLRKRCLLCSGYYRIIKHSIKVNGVKPEAN